MWRGKSDISGFLLTDNHYELCAAPLTINSLARYVRGIWKDNLAAGIKDNDSQSSTDFSS
jgi:hypothetical protein